MKTELGFELLGRFRMPNDEPPGLEGGQVIAVSFGNVVVPCIVIKAVVDGDDRVISFATPMVTAIAPPAAGDDPTPAD